MIGAPRQSRGSSSFPFGKKSRGSPSGSMATPALPSLYPSGPSGSGSPLPSFPPVPTAPALTLCYPSASYALLPFGLLRSATLSPTAASPLPLRSLRSGPVRYGYGFGKVRLGFPLTLCYPSAPFLPPSLRLRLRLPFGPVRLKTKYRPKGSS
uniref:Uncharacterized protein n=1 Tax=Haematococcus lacustris TaxID=44745 RepID=A0A2K9YRT1_HAELA|nr:hypothetical protein SG3EUKT975005.1 [Haematococcus lacustris]AUW36458.1 hypothetical protein SG3EUKT975005.1 [Haematococcus lacustris]